MELRGTNRRQGPSRAGHSDQAAVNLWLLSGTLISEGVGLRLCTLPGSQSTDSLFNNLRKDSSCR